jgi:cytochrome c-type biogenesis protein CcmF
MMAMVLTGTLYPLLVDALGAGKISVGPPYFGLLFSLLLVPLVLALPIGIYSNWKQDSASRLVVKLRWPLLISLVVGASAWLIEPSIGYIAAAGVTGGVWVISGSLFYFGKQVFRNNRFRLPVSALAMTLAHVGLGVFLIGVSLTSAISSEKHLRMAPGDQHAMAGYTFEFLGTSIVEGPNYMAKEGEFVVSKDGQEVTRLYSQKRQYAQGGNTMTEAAIDPGWTRDLYVSLGEPLDEVDNAWAVRIYHKPFIRWIWLGSIFMLFGGLVAAGDRRYRRKSTADSPVTEGSEGIAA